MAELSDPASQEAMRILQEAQPVRAEAQTLEVQRREEMSKVMTEMKAARERIGNFCTTIEADPTTPTSKEALLLPRSTQREDRSKGVNQWGQGKFTSINVVISEDGYWVDESENMQGLDSHFGEDTLQPYEAKDAGTRKIVYRTLSDADAVVNPISQERLVGHVLHVPGTNYGQNLRPATTEDVVSALKNNITAAQSQHRPTLEKAQADIATTQAVRQILPNTP